MLPEKTNISARVEMTLKKIVEDSTFTHKDAYELGAKLIAIGDAEETIALIDKDPVLQKIIKQSEYRLIQAKKEQLEKELRDL
ncbi:hypothetical protein [uncultured Methanobrevibacter sp.]|uniref:hypothetical protein n=1 Tax=uncultured Methanobrevibacter sp. TaxID=253161 RepID=UPI0025EE2B3B|nr:hypothetical protein [uncultured Methanobrevibacter sp.]